MLVKITRIHATDKTKEGVPCLDKNQRPYWRVGIQTEQHGKTWLGGIAYQGSPLLSWKAGDEKEIEVSQRGQYTNFSLPRENKGQSNAEVMVELKAIKGYIQQIHAMVSNLMPADPLGEPVIPQSPEVEDMSQEELDASTLPF